MTASSHPTQPCIRKFGKPGSGDGSDSVGVDDIRNQMNDQNSEGGCGDDTSTVAVVEAEG